MSFFQREYKELAVAASITFAGGIGILALFTQSLDPTPPLALAVEVILYGILWVSAIWWFVMMLDDTLAKRRMLIPSILAAIVLFGCITFAILSHDSHVFVAGLVIALVLLTKGFFGAVASAVTLTLAAYGILHRGGDSIPLIKTLVEFITGHINATLQYVVSIVIVAGSLANLFTSDTSYD